MDIKDLPPVLYRKSDGERFLKQEDGTYCMETSMMVPPYRYSYRRLMDHGFTETYIPKGSAPPFDEHNAHE